MLGKQIAYVQDHPSCCVIRQISFFVLAAEGLHLIRDVHFQNRVNNARICTERSSIKKILFCIRKNTVTKLFFPQDMGINMISDFLYFS